MACSKDRRIVPKGDGKSTEGDVAIRQGSKMGPRLEAGQGELGVAARLFSMLMIIIEREKVGVN